MMFTDHVSTRVTAAIAVTLAAGALATASAAQADPGDLDSTFGSGGIVLSDLDTVNGSTIDDVAVQPDGKVMALERAFGAGTRHLLRYLPDGTPDPSFSDDGIAPVPSEIRATDLALQPDGRIVVSGPDAAGGYAVARFLLDGGLDDSFDGDGGNANGVVHTQLTAGPDLPTALTIDNQGRIVVAGQADSDVGKGGVGIVRFLSDGKLDKSYAGDGSFVSSITLVEQAVWDVATQDDGKVVVAGGMFSFPVTDTMLQRTTADGKVDKFGPGSAGRVVLDLDDGSDAAVSIAVQPGGQLLVASDAPGERDRLIRLSPNGDLDAGFAGGGNVLLGYDVSALALAPDGKIALAGRGKLDGVSSFAVERRNADGTPDATFVGGAPLLTRVVPGERALSTSVAVASDAKIVLVGETGQFPDSRAAVVRYQGATNTGTPPAPGLTLATDRTVVTYGQTARLSGSLTLSPKPVSGAQVQLAQQQPSGQGTFGAFATPITDAAGNYAHDVAPTQHTSYQANYPGAITPVAVTVQVRHKITLSARRRGTRLRLRGSVGPAHPGKTVTIQIRKRAGWQRYARLKTNSRSAFSAIKRIRARGKFRFRAKVGADAVHLAGTSRVAYVTPHTVSLAVALSGRKATFTGTASPAHPGNTVVLKERRSGRWATIAQLRLSRRSTFRLAKKIAPGKHDYQVTFPGDRRHWPGKSVVRTVTAA